MGVKLQPDYTNAFLMQLKAFKLPKPQLEYKFHPTRKWRFDFAWPLVRIAVEIEGGLYKGGRHTSIRGFTSDCEKYNNAQLMLWSVFRFPSKQVSDGSAVGFMGGVFRSINKSIPDPDNDRFMVDIRTRACDD